MKIVCEQMGYERRYHVYYRSHESMPSSNCMVTTRPKAARLEGTVSTCGFAVYVSRKDLAYALREIRRNQLEGKVTNLYRDKEPYMQHNVVADS